MNDIVVAAREEKTKTLFNTVTVVEQDNQHFITWLSNSNIQSIAWKAVWRLLYVVSQYQSSAPTFFQECTQKFHNSI